MQYEFTFVIEGVDSSDERVVTALYDHFDATLARGAGVDLLLITAEGISAVNAAQNAIMGVEYVAPQVKFLYLDRDLVGISEIAERTSRSRQNVTQWVNGERHATNEIPFPKVEGVVGRARIWLWSEVNAWLRMLDLGDEIPSPKRCEITDIDFLIRHRYWLNRHYSIADGVWPFVSYEIKDSQCALPATATTAVATDTAWMTNFDVATSTTDAHGNTNFNFGRWIAAQVVSKPS